MMRQQWMCAYAARGGLMVAIYLVFAVTLPSYHRVAGVASLLDGAFLTGVIAMGVGLTMIAGEMDLSVGSMAAVAGVLSIRLEGLGIVPAIILTTMAAALIGGIQGWCIARLRISSLIFTVGTLMAFRGFALIVAGEQTVNIPIADLDATDFLSRHWLFFSPLSVSLFMIALLIYLFSRVTIWGREIYAIGGGRAEARAAGVPVGRPMIIAFAISAGLAGYAGAVMSLQADSATPLGYEAVLLDAVTVCLIGGTALRGGEGGVPGILIGLFILRFLISGIASLGAPFWAQSLASGVLLISLILVEGGYAIMVRRRAFAVRSVAGGR